MKLSKMMCLFSLIMILGCGGGGGGGSDDSAAVIPTCDSPGISHVNDFGFYWTASAAYGNHLADTADYTNFAYVHMTFSDWDYSMELLEEAVDRGLTPMIYFDARGVWLEHDWSRKVHINQANWDTIVEDLTPYADNLIVYAFDEPDHWNISVNTQEWVISYWNQAFPDAPVWVTYGNENSPVASNADVISVTPNYGNNTAQQYQYKLNKISESMYSHQTFAITFDTYDSDNDNSDIENEHLGDTVIEFARIAKCDERITGFFFFLYPDQSGNGGVESMPGVEEDIIYLWDKIGE
jgi:hypothetical protein